MAALTSLTSLRSLAQQLPERMDIIQTAAGEASFSLRAMRIKSEAINGAAPHEARELER